MSAHDPGNWVIQFGRKRSTSAEIGDPLRPKQVIHFRRNRRSTSSEIRNSQAAIPLATLSAERTTNLYDLMDAAYDAEPIRQHSRSLGHVPLLDTNPRRDKALAEELRTEARRLQRIGFQLPEQARYNERTAGERVNGRLKDEFGGRHVRVRGASKVMCHCMFGVLALTADQLVRLVT